MYSIYKYNGIVTNIYYETNHSLSVAIELGKISSIYLNLNSLLIITSVNYLTSVRPVHPMLKFLCTSFILCTYL